MGKAMFVFGLTTWIAVVALGFGGLAVYESRPGLRAVAPQNWPVRSRFARDPDRWTLLLFLHPRCPCSQASLQELEELLPGNAARLRARIICNKPKGVPEGWEKTATWRQAMAMKNVDVICDENDGERACFGVATSGQVLLYDPNGELRYSGGITRSRGHPGANAGRAAIESLLRGESPRSNRQPVFGCPLVDPETFRGEKGCPCPEEP